MDLRQKILLGTAIIEAILGCPVLYGMWHWWREQQRQHQRSFGR